jgi:hypothetical protein
MKKEMTHSFNIPDGEMQFHFDIPNGRAKFKELVLHIADALKYDQWFGAAKLNKILWMSDFSAFTSTGLPITGVKYRKLPLGPVPAIITEIKNELIRANHARVILEDVGTVHPQERLLPLRSIDYTDFRPIDIVISNRVVNQTRDLRAQEVIAQSHGIAWNTTADYEFIPYEAAFLSDEPYTMEEIELTQRLARTHGWN